MDLDFKILDSERLITEVEKKPALYNWLTDWLISIWVRGPTAPMHVALYNKPLVPHNVINSVEAYSLLKFQMVPRLNF